MVLDLKRTIQYFGFLLPAVILYGPYLTLFKVGGMGVVTFSRLYYYVWLLLGLIYFLQNRSITFRFGQAGRHAVFFLILLLYATVSLLWVKDMTYSYLHAYIYLFTDVLIILLIPAALETREDLAALMRIVSICYILTVLLGVFETVTGIYIFSQNPNALLDSRVLAIRYPYATFYNTNDYCSFVVLFLPLVCYRIVCDFPGARGKVFAGVLSAAAIFTFIHSRARACYFAIAVAVIVFFIALAHKKVFKNYRKFLITSVVILAVGALVVLSLFPSALSGIGQKLNSVNGKDHSIGIRMQLFYAGIRMLQDYHFMGVGAGNSVPLVPSYSSLQPINLHGFPLILLAEYGVIVFGYYVLTVVGMSIAFIQCAARRIRDRVWLCICFAQLCGFQIISFESSDATHVTILWVFFGILLATIKLLPDSADYVGSVNFSTGRLRSFSP